MFLKEIRNIFVSRTEILCPQQVLRAGANRETFVSATVCPRLPITITILTGGLPSPSFEIDSRKQNLEIESLLI